jgi:hypothetical protein
VVVCWVMGRWGDAGGVSAAASPPTGSPPQYSPALHWVTTGFGMGPGGASTLSATNTPPPSVRPHRSATQSGMGMESTRKRWDETLVTSGDCRAPGRERGVPFSRMSTTACRGRSTLGHEHGSAPVRYRPSTPRLSTWSSPRGLSFFRRGDSSWSGIPA